MKQKRFKESKEVLDLLSIIKLFRPRFALFSSPPAGALGEGIDQFKKSNNLATSVQIIYSCYC